MDRLDDEWGTEQPSYTLREVWLARGICMALAGLVLAMSLWAWTGSTGWFRAFLATYGMMVVVTTVVAQIPRRIQKRLDHEWAARLRELAIHDELTGLFNRRHFNFALERALREGASGVAVAVVDLDDFKRINDTLGHAAGDLGLRIAAAALKGAAPDGVVARMGGDEFAVLFIGLGLHGEGAVGRSLVEAIRTAPSVVEEGSDVTLSGSVGVARLTPGMDAEELLRTADRALYDAKRERSRTHERRRAA